MIDWQDLARAFAETKTKLELEFYLVELLKQRVQFIRKDEQFFWDKVEEYCETRQS